MSEGLERVLQESYDLIEAGKLDEARLLLKPALETEKDNADLWWLYAHAVSDVDTARLALNNVLRIDKDYPEARNLLRKLDEQASTPNQIDFADEPAFVPPMGNAQGTTPATEKLHDDSERESSHPVSTPFYARPGCYLPAFGLLLIATLLVVIFRPFATNAPSLLTPTAEDIQGQSSALGVTPSDESVVVETPSAEFIADPTLEIMSTDLVTSPEPSLSVEAEADLTQTLQATLTESYQLSESSVSIAENGILSVGICTFPGIALRSTLSDVMNSLSQYFSSSSSDQVSAVNVSLYECNSNTLLRTMTANIENMILFASGEMNEQEFTASWVSS
jgi:hypothetical protein